MRDVDVTGFAALMRRLTVLQRMDVTDLQAVTSSYFRALQRFDLVDLERAVDRWLEKETRFPKPAQLVALAYELRRPAAAPVEAMTEPEAREWVRAERQHWEGDACGCLECQSHGVGEVPRRFVPLFDRDDREVKGRVGDRIVTRGEWVHGAALMNWHLARERFYTTARAHKAERFADLVGARTGRA